MALALILPSVAAALDVLPACAAVLVTVEDAGLRATAQWSRDHAAPPDLEALSSARHPRVVVGTDHGSRLQVGDAGQLSLIPRLEIQGEDGGGGDEAGLWRLDMADGSFIVGSDTRAAGLSLAILVGQDGAATPDPWERGCLALERMSHQVQAVLAGPDGDTARQTMRGLSDTVAWGLFGLDARGQVVFQNLEAERIIAAQLGITLQNQRIRLGRAAADRQLTHNIGRAISPDRHILLGHAESLPPIAMPDREGLTRCVIDLLVLDTTSGTKPGDIVAFVRIVDLQSGHAPSRRTLRHVFSLSEKESEVAALFARGFAIDEAARAMGISPNTCRVHLQNIFSKTGTNSQACLARLLGRLPALLPADGAAAGQDDRREALNPA